MYGLKKAVLLTYKNLVKNPAPCGYVPCKYFTDIWRSTMKKHYLCVYDFGVKYFYNTEADHIFNTL